MAPLETCCTDGILVQHTTLCSKLPNCIMDLCLSLLLGSLLHQRGSGRNHRQLEPWINPPGQFHKVLHETLTRKWIECPRGWRWHQKVRTNLSRDGWSHPRRVEAAMGLRVLERFIVHVVLETQLQWTSTHPLSQKSGVLGLSLSCIINISCQSQGLRLSHVQGASHCQSLSDIDLCHFYRTGFSPQHAQQVHLNSHRNEKERF